MSKPIETSDIVGVCGYRTKFSDILVALGCSSWDVQWELARRGWEMLEVDDMSLRGNRIWYKTYKTPTSAMGFELMVRYE